MSTIKRIELPDGRTRYRFVVDVGRKPDGRRDQRTFTFDRLKDARAELARIQHEVKGGTYVRPSRSLTVEAYLGQWRESKAGRKPATVRCYEDALKPVVDRYGRLPLQALDAPHLEALKRAMLSGEARRRGTPGKPLSARAVNLTLTVTGMALRAAVARGLVARNVADLVERVPSDADSSERGTWQTADAVAFLRSVHGDRLYAAWLLSMLGLRRGEVLGLRWQDVDLDAGTIAVRENRISVAGQVHVGTPKAKASRRVLPLPPVVVDALRELHRTQTAERLAAGAAYSNPDGRIVVDEIGHAPRPETYSDTFARLVQRAGLPKIPLHGARHTAASLLADLGYPAVVTASWLGQSQISVTHSYQHAFADSLRAAGKALGKALAG